MYHGLSYEVNRLGAIKRYAGLKQLHLLCNQVHKINYFNYGIETSLPGVCAVFDSAFLQRN